MVKKLKIMGSKIADAITNPKVSLKSTFALVASNDLIFINPDNVLLYSELRDAVYRRSYGYITNYNLKKFKKGMFPIYIDKNSYTYSSMSEYIPKEYMKKGKIPKSELQKVYSNELQKRNIR